MKPVGFRSRRPPFPATGEIVAGFWIWQVTDMDDAVAGVKRCPNPMPGPSEIEIRPIQGIHDVLTAKPSGSGQMQGPH